MFEKGQVVERYFESVDELAQHEKPALHCAEKALLEMLEEGKRPTV
jgi:DNA topoisomerase-1